LLLLSFFFLDELSLLRIAMNSFCVFLLLASTVLAIDVYDIMPCAFELMTYTRVLSGGSLLTTSKDAIYRDHDNLWRWDSEFDGLPGFFDGHEWSVIWRPDEETSYHHFTLEGKCVKNSGRNMYPFPYEWIESKTDGVSWSQEDCTYDDEPAIMYSAKTTSKQYKFTGIMNLFQIKKTGDFVFGNGTVAGSLIDVTFEIEITKFTHNSPLPSSIFVTSAPCPATTIPADPSREFKQICYGKQNPSDSSSRGGSSRGGSSGGGGAVVKPSFLFFLATLLAALMIAVAM